MALSTTMIPSSAIKELEQHIANNQLKTLVGRQIKLGYWRHRELDPLAERRVR